MTEHVLLLVSAREGTVVPLPGAAVVPCTVCGHGILLGQASQAAIPKGGIPICVECDEELKTATPEADHVDGVLLGTVLERDALNRSN